ncbi:MAG: hypothetical protein ACPIA1_04725 [Flavobacteriaceae bacterium]
MINTILLALLLFTLLVMILFWYASYSSRSGFAKDENNNGVPDSWEGRFHIFFKLKNIIILILGIAIGYLLSLSTFI